MVASARFCSSPVSAAAAQETLKRFQYESIQTLFSLSLFPCVSPTLFPTTTFSIVSFAPIPRPNFFPPYSFFPLLYLTVFFYRSSTHEILSFPPLFRTFSESREARNRIESRHLRNLFRETIIFSCRYQLCTAVGIWYLHISTKNHCYPRRNSRSSPDREKRQLLIPFDRFATLWKMTVRLSSFRPRRIPFSSFEGAKSPTSGRRTPSRESSGSNCKTWPPFPPISSVVVVK